jgi:hypothetical protein
MMFVKLNSLIRSRITLTFSIGLPTDWSPKTYVLKSRSQLNFWIISGSSITLLWVQ